MLYSYKGIKFLAASIKGSVDLKFIKRLFTTIIIIGIIGFSIYHFGTKFIADKVMEQVSAELENSGQLENIKSAIENDPELRAFLEEGKNADQSKLPFQTKEQAVKTLVKKFDVSEIQELTSKAQGGLTAAEAQNLFSDIESKLTDDEVLALKMLAYKELYPGE